MANEKIKWFYADVNRQFGFVGDKLTAVVRFSEGHNEAGTAKGGDMPYVVDCVLTGTLLGCLTVEIGKEMAEKYTV